MRCMDCGRLREALERLLAAVEDYESTYMRGLGIGPVTDAKRKARAALQESAATASTVNRQPWPSNHLRTYSLVGSPHLFLVTDDESGINIGYADKVGGPLVEPFRAVWGEKE